MFANARALLLDSTRSNLSEHDVNQDHAAHARDHSCALMITPTRVQFQSLSSHHYCIVKKDHGLILITRGGYQLRLAHQPLPMSKQPAYAHFNRPRQEACLQ
jgi:hypothetical protein